MSDHYQKLQLKVLQKSGQDPPMGSSARVAESPTVGKPISYDVESKVIPIGLMNNRLRDLKLKQVFICNGSRSLQYR